MHAWEGNAERAALVRRVHPVEQAHRAGLGEAVALAQLDAGQVEPSVLQLHGEWSATADAHAQP